MHFPNILLPILLCTASSTMPIGSLDTNTETNSRLFQTCRNPSSNASLDARPLRARRSDGSADNGMQLSPPTTKARPRFPPSSDDLPPLANMMAQSNNLSLPLRDIIALEHYRYRDKLPPGYATAYDAQRERNRTISDEVARCLTIFNDCEDVDSHHHRMDRGEECTEVRNAGETLFDQEMVLVEQGKMVFQSLKASGLQKREEDKRDDKREPWPFRCHFPLGLCPGYPPSCHYWVFEWNCWYRDIYQVPERELKRIDGIKDFDEKLKAEAELGNRINNINSRNGYESRSWVAHRGLPINERSGPFEGVDSAMVVDEIGSMISKVIAKRGSKKPLPWEIVGVGMPITSEYDKWGNDIWATCTDTWMEPGAVGEINAELLADQVK